MKDTKLSRDGSIHVTDEKINTITAIIGVMFSVTGVGVLVVKLLEISDFWTIFAVALYGVSLINMFAMSALHHAINIPGKVNSVLRTLDYAAIFGLIAGTVTPLILIKFRGPLGISILIVTWLLAAAGISIRASIPKVDKHITNTMFIVLGWMPAFIILSDPKVLSGAEYSLLILGGVIYSFGFLMYASERPNPVPGKFGFHEIWHCLVLFGAFAHWVLMLLILKAQ